MDMFKLQRWYFGLYEKLKRRQIKRYVDSIAKANTPKQFKLSVEQKKQAVSFFSSYKKISTLYHRFYTYGSGVFSPYYLPMDMYINDVDEYFNNRAESKFLDNKCYYNAIFREIPQPQLIVSKIGGLWFSSNFEQISFETVKEIIDLESVAFAKVAEASSGGKGVAYLSTENGSMSEQLERFVSGVQRDIVVQKKVEQHKDLTAIHESSVNTYRILSLLTQEGVKIYSSILRMGVGGERVDNASKGGIACGIDENGLLKKYAHKITGQRYEAHPTNGFVFEGYQLPSVDKAKELVKKAHPMVPHFKLVSWDIAILENGEPVMIEANLAKGMSELHQFCNGPLFGDDTKGILDKVYENNK